MLPLSGAADAVVRGRAAAEGSTAADAASCAKGAALDADGVSGSNVAAVAAAVCGEAGGGAELVTAFLVGVGVTEMGLGRGLYDRIRGAGALSGVMRGVSAAIFGADTKSAAIICSFHSPPSPPATTQTPPAATPAPTGGGEGDGGRFAAVSALSTGHVGEAAKAGNLGAADACHE